MTSKEAEKITRTAREALHCKDASRASPLLAQAYRHRSEVLHVVVEKACSALDGSRAPQLLLLGAGLDTSYEKLYGDRAFAVDLPSVVEQRSGEAKAMGIAADLRDADALIEQLSAFDFGRNTVILVEMVLNYLPSHAVGQLILRLSTEFTRMGGQPILVCYDYFTLSETSGFSKVMLDAFRARGAPLEHVLTKRRDQYDFLCGKGWPSSYVGSIGAAMATFRDRGLIVNSAFRAANPPGPAPFFDEHASLALLERHYHITIAGHNEDRKDTLCQLCSDLGLSAKYSGGSSSGLPPEEPIHVPGTPTITIRRMPSGNDKGLKSIWDAASELYATGMRPCADKYSAVAKFTKKARKQIQSPWLHSKAPVTETGTGCTFWVAEEDTGGVDGEKSVVGLVGVRGNNSGTQQQAAGVLELCHMAVAERCRGKGVATSLLDAVFSFLQKHPPLSSSASSWRLELTVLVDLRQALALYSRAGFAPVGDPATLTNETGPPCSLQRMSLLLTK